MALYLPATETSAENTVPGLVTVAPGRKEASMDNELIMRIANYRVAMSLANEMLENGIISSEEYAKIDTIMTKKYGLSSCTIFRE